MNNYLNFKK